MSKFIMEQTKICITCNIQKNREHFYPRGEKLRGECKECTRQRKKDWNMKNAERKKIYDSDYRNDEKNKVSMKEYQAKYYVENKEKKRELERINSKKRYEVDNNYRIKKLLSARLTKAMNGKYKNISSKKLLGCTIDEFKHWIEYQFDDNMTWNNHGDYWHIDHIKPCASFNLEDKEQQKRCFHWTNMRPLPATTNLEKKDKYNAQIECFAFLKLREYLSKSISN